MKEVWKKVTKNGRIFWVAYFCFFIILMTPMQAKAYVDPATLTYLVQIVAGIFIAGGVAVGVYWRKIKKAFSKNKKDDKATVVKTEDRNAAAAAAEEDEEE